MKMKLVALCLAIALAACQNAGPTVDQTAAKPGPIGQTDKWQIWYVGDAYTLEETETSDWWQARVQGTAQTTLIAECNGNDPTAFNLSIEQRQGRFLGMTQPFAIEVLSTQDGSFFREETPGVPDTTAPFPVAYEASKDLSAAMRDGNEIVLIFQDLPPYRYSLRGSARIMDRMSCDASDQL